MYNLEVKVRVYRKKRTIIVLKLKKKNVNPGTGTVITSWYLLVM